MSKGIFSNTANLQHSVLLVNDLDSSKFPLLLNRISQKLHLKDERAFTDEEEEKLQQTLELCDPGELDPIIQMCEFVLHQAAYHSLKPAVFGEELTNIFLMEDKVSIFVDTWANCGKQVTESLRKNSILPKQLDSVNWQLNLQMAQSNLSKMKQPNAQLQLTVNNDQTKEKEKIQLEFSHSELYSFYNQLETIQSQIDGLT